MLARQGVPVNRKGAELYVNTMKPPETDVISRYAGERLVLIDRQPYGTFPSHSVVFTFPSEPLPTTAGSLWKDKMVTSKALRFEIYAAEYDWEALLLQSCYPFLEKLTLNRPLYGVV